MALMNKIDPEQAAARFAQSLQAQIPGAEDVHVTDMDVPRGAGFSNETLRFTASWTENGEPHQEQLVARVQPSGKGVLPTYDLSLEYRLMAALRDTPVPVPRVLVFEEDTAVFGAPFLIMEFVSGRVPSDDPSYTKEGWVVDELSPAQRRALCENGLKVLVDVHSVDWEQLGLGFLERRELGERPVDQQIAYYERYWEWAAGGQGNPTVAGAFDWVRGNRPVGPEPKALSWGDAKIGNMLFDEQLAVVAALDWEMASLANPELDLGWWLFLLRYHTEGIGLTALPEGILNRDEVISHYEALSGRHLENMFFYEVVGGLRLATIMHRATIMMIEGGLLPPDTTGAYNNPATLPLARMLGLPDPEGVLGDPVAATRTTDPN
jgi:aminoglycoside phosphotransferase (APT) family kinase protein